MKKLGVALGLLATTWALALGGVKGGWVTCWPAAVALVGILLSRQAIVGLAAGVLAGALLLAQGRPVEMVRVAMEEHGFPSLEGSWHVGALVFTLLLGAFAGVLESSGGFAAILQRMLGRGAADRRVLGSAYAMGLLCFFDGLANSLLVGRICRQAADRAGVSREKLAWVVDSTSSPVACVAFVSTWIATQLTLIGDSLPGADAYGLYFRSIGANPYCVLTLLLIPVAVFFRWEPGPMKGARAVDLGDDKEAMVATAAWRAVVPLMVLAGSIAISLQWFSGNPVRVLSLDAWRQAASSSAGPVALVTGAVAGLLAAWGCHPRRDRAGAAAVAGAAGLLPALVILVLAWTLGSVFQAMGAAEALQGTLGRHVAAPWLPLAVFGTAALTSFATGSSWGTMALVMPLALGLATAQAGFDPAALPAVIGAVFGGAVFGDHASPFSDTTIVSALASGCEPVAHVATQWPYAAVVAAVSAGVYALMAVGCAAPLATGLGALGLLGGVVVACRRASFSNRQ
ncbi:Na+/H+ antiporter NhaC [Haloferula luteola]|uniref:Na+/H+ antiporter NhaC n=1 Tax=Haloferula luteola TaxID=595692 RepID=A0A840V5G6_9BACT|nr:Na+/H+ antiporter NhaC family protein [Haloferula luteola]MBB5352873.1 Na+/H+ antiporter NhaC [Haloferula luteola]